MAEHVITLRGEPVAILRPLTEEERDQLGEEQTDSALIEMRSLSWQAIARGPLAIHPLAELDERLGG